MVFQLSDPMKDLGLVARHSFVGQLRERLFKLYQLVTISIDVTTSLSTGREQTSNGISVRCR